MIMMINYEQKVLHLTHLLLCLCWSCWLGAWRGEQTLGAGQSQGHTSGDLTSRGSLSEIRLFYYPFLLGPFCFESGLLGDQLVQKKRSETDQLT